MHGKIKNILKKTALLLTLGITCLTAVSIGKPQEVQAASHIYKNKTFYVYAEHAVTIQSWYSDDKIDEDKKLEWNNRGLGTITVQDVGLENHVMKDGKTKSCHKYEVKWKMLMLKIRHRISAFLLLQIKKMVIIQSVPVLQRQMAITAVM